MNRTQRARRRWCRPGLRRSRAVRRRARFAARNHDGYLITKPIPSSSEQIPVVGIGTARRYDVQGTSAELQPLREVVRDFVALGGKLIDIAGGYGRAEQVLGQLMAELGIRDQIFLERTRRRMSALVHPA